MTRKKGSKQTWRFTTENQNLVLASKNQLRMHAQQLHHNTSEQSVICACLPVRAQEQFI